MAILRLAGAAFERAEHAEFTLDRDPTPMGHFNDGFGDTDVILIIGGCLAVGLQGAIHHHGGEVGLDRRHAGGFAIAVIEMDANGDLRVNLGDGIHHMAEHNVIGVLAGAAGGLNDDGRVRRFGGNHDGECLFHIVDVEGRNAIAVFGCVIEQLSQRDARHVFDLRKSLSDWNYRIGRKTQLRTLKKNTGAVAKRCRTLQLRQYSLAYGCVIRIHTCGMFER